MLPSCRVAMMLSSEATDLLGCGLQVAFGELWSSVDLQRELLSFDLGSC